MQREKVELTPAVAMSADDGEAMVAAAIAGVGVAQIPSYMAARALASGDLVRILQQFEPERNPLSAVYPSSRHVSKPVRAIVDLLARVGRRSPWSP